MITAEQARIFGLVEQEKKILNLLLHSKNDLIATDICEKISEPRTTVNFHLRKLLAKGWVVRLKKPGFPYPLWRLVEKNNIKNSANNFFTQLGISPAALATSIPKEGYEQILTAYEKILEVGKEERVFIIQGSRAPEEALNRLSVEFVEKMHAIQKQKPIILEGITSQKGLAVFEKMNHRELQSHYGRLTVVYVLPDEFLDFDEEIYIFQKSLVIIQLGAGRSFVIEDETTARVFRMLIEFIKPHTNKINLNAYIKDLIDKKTKPGGAH